MRKEVWHVPSEDNPAVSFVVPVHNVEPYLVQCIRSILAQTLKDIEVVCVNDGSTDRSLEVLNEYALSDPRIRVFSKDNGGVSSARNMGIEQVRGRYVSFIDADDWVDERYAETLFNLAEENNADIVVFSGSSVPQVSWIEQVLVSSTAVLHEHGADVLLHKTGCIPLMCNKLYKRTIITDHHVRFDEEIALGEDLLFQFATFSHAQTVVFSEAKLYFYRTDREGSAVASAADIPTVLRKHIVLLHKAVEIWKKNNCLNGRELELLEATNFLFSDIYLLDMATFNQIAQELFEQVEQDFGKDALRSTFKPKAFTFYATIQRAVQKKDSVFTAWYLKLQVFRKTRQRK